MRSLYVSLSVSIYVGLLKRSTYVTDETNKRDVQKELYGYEKRPWTPHTAATRQTAWLRRQSHSWQTRTPAAHVYPTPMSPPTFAFGATPARPHTILVFHRCKVQKHMFIYVYVYAYIYIYIYVHIHMYIYI